MKALYSIIAMATILLSACTTLPKPQVNSAIIDYQILSNHNIYASESNSVSFDYTPIGSFSFYAVGGYDDVKGYYDPINPTIYDLYAKLIQDAQKKNANGIINFNITTRYSFLSNRSNCLTIDASGMLINIPGKPQPFYECIEKGEDSVIILRESENELIAISKTKLRKYVVEELCKGRKENIQFWWYDNNFANFVNGEVKYGNIETDDSDY